MARDIVVELQSITLRVLEEYDEEQRAHVAYCLETGAVATGDTAEEAHKLIKQVLESDILLAIQAGHVRGFFRSPASGEIFDRWYAAKSDGTVETETLNIVLPNQKRGVKSELSIVKTACRQIA